MPPALPFGEPFYDHTGMSLRNLHVASGPSFGEEMLVARWEECGSCPGDEVRTCSNKEWHDLLLYCMLFLGFCYFFENFVFVFIFHCLKSILKTYFYVPSTT